jgi:hypothetical protein
VSVKIDKDTSAFPTEFGAMAGISLALSGQLPTAILAGVLWFVLHRIRAGTSAQVLLVTSILIATFLLGLIAIAAGMAVPLAAVEMIAVTTIALLLFFTGASVWAYILIAHSAYIVLLRILSFQNASFTANEQGMVVGAIALKLLIIWMLISHLRGSISPAPSPAGELSADENAESTSR